MERKQYLAMAEIMADCRKFSVQMYTKMLEAGIMFKGNHHLTLDIGRQKIGDRMRNITIALQPDSLAENWYQDRMEQDNFSMEGWVVIHDPIAKDGTVPFDFCPYGLPNIVCYSPERGCLGKEKTGANAVRSCDSGMWFRNDDNDLPMVDRGGVNGNLADG